MLERAADILGYSFQDETLLAHALTHSSYADHRLKSNERMEFLGDAILGYVVCERLFSRFPDLLEGEMTKIKSAVVSRKACAQISRRIRLADMLNLGKGMAGRAALPSSVAAAVLESIIAAIYLDGGMASAQAFIIKHFEPMIDRAAQSSHQHNFKSALQQYAQQRLPGNPLYILLDEKGPDHAKCFHVCVEIAGTRYEGAWAQSKKEAEQQAALLALKQLGVAHVDEDGHIELS